MSLRVNLIERHSAPSPSIERVFRTVAKNLKQLGIQPAFQKLPFGDGVINVIKNLLRFRAESADVFHVTGHVTYIVLALPAMRTVVTFHDLTILKTAKGLRRFALKKLYYEWPLRRATVVTAISENTARELSEELGSRWIG